MSNRTTFGMGMTIGLVIALGAFILLRSPEVALAEASSNGEGMSVIPVFYESNQQLIIVVDPVSKHILMYDTNRGKNLTLRSSRNMMYDVQIPLEFHTRATDSDVSSSGQSVKGLKEAFEKINKEGEGGGLK